MTLMDKEKAKHVAIEVAYFPKYFARVLYEALRYPTVASEVDTHGNLISREKRN